MTGKVQVQHAARFLHGSTMGHVVRMTLTSMFGLTFLFLVDVINLFWISWLGDERLTAALGFAWTVQFFTLSAGVGFMIATAALVARALGAGSRTRARRYGTGASLMTVLVLSAVALLVLLLRDEILALVGATGRTRSLASDYLFVVMLSLPLMAVGFAGSGILRGEGDAWRSMLITLVSGLLAMVLDPILILGLDMGLQGAAWAVLLSRLLGAAVALHAVVVVHRLIEWPRWRDVRLAFRPFWAIALPALLTQFSTPVGNSIVTSAVASFGDGSVAGWAVVSRVNILAFGGLFALSGAIGGIIGQNAAAGRWDRVRRAYLDALKFVLVYTLIVWALLAAFSDVLAGFFALGSEGREVFRAFTHVTAGAYIFAGAQFVALAAFNNLERPIWATIANWGRDGVLMYPSAHFGALLFMAPGVVYGQGFANAFAGVITGFVGWRLVNRLARGAGDAPERRRRGAAPAAPDETARTVVAKPS